MNHNNIWVLYGDDPKSMVLEILNKVQPEKELDKDSNIGINQTLVVPSHLQAEQQHHRNWVEGIIEYFQSKGYMNISILEGSWIGDRTSRAFRICGYEDISDRYNVPLIDSTKGWFHRKGSRRPKAEYMQKYLPNRLSYQCTGIKGHCQTNITCALKNLKGAFPNSEKRRFHTMGLHKPIAYLSKAIRQDLIVVDGIMGDLNFEEGGNPVRMNRVLVGTDPVMMDSYAADLLGFDLEDVPYIKMAEDIGAGKTDWSGSVIELNSNEGIKSIRTRAG